MTETLSTLVIHDIASGEERIVLHSPKLIEAPNWTPCGGALIVNGEGRLFRVPLKAPALEPIGTGFAHKLNNDHGISPDGSRLVISDATEAGASLIYTLPVGGGTPRRVTPLAPSYWHGWSPDGGQLAYVARRGEGSFQVYTCPAGGGDETCLTEGFDHCDGPDYTPCGRWIWFNGEQDCAVDLWRIPAGGGTPERMTTDDDVNWFPHPSPCGEHVLYLAYAPGTRGHPRGCEVALRLMPAEGGKARTLTTLFGGQGSINVPCWAPEGQRFAYMRYTRPAG